MVSKLLLAVGEDIVGTRHVVSVTDQQNTASDAGEALARLIAHYREIRDGIGSHKSPQQYGSFPFDAYSHTPSMAGVQQPGMTGQVKEDIINRFFELGIEVHNGEIHISQGLLQSCDFHDGKLDFTYCAVTFVYECKPVAPATDQQNVGTRHAVSTNGNGLCHVCVEFADGTSHVMPASVISRDVAAHIFARDGFVKQVNVQFQ